MNEEHQEQPDEIIQANKPSAPLPIVAIVGRPNVGKSTLFNRLVGKRSAIVHDEPGVTRDRHYGDVTSNGRKYTLIDTGGFDPDSDDPMRKGIKRQIDVAITEADVIVCVLDGSAPPTPADHAELDLLRRSGKPVIYCANKADSQKHELDANDLYRLGATHIIAVSALHGRRINDLEDAIDEALPPAPPEEEVVEGAEAENPPIRVAILGKPNAGKSSLVNRLLGEERLIVDARPGTTRDAIDTRLERDGQSYLLIDTAGIRRKAKVTKEDSVVEAVSVLHAIRAMERAEVVVLLCDAAEGVAEQDAKILSLAVDRGSAVIVGVNKTDLLDKKGLAKAIEATKDKLAFAPWVPVLPVSAKNGRGITSLLAMVKRTAKSYRSRVPTGELNRFFESVLEHRPPPTQGGKAPRLFYITQAETCPPLFVVMASNPEKIHTSYMRYVQNQLRKSFGFEGVPVRVKYKARRRTEKGAAKSA